MQPTVYLIINDRAELESVQSALREAGLRVEAYAGAHEFLEAAAQGVFGCLVADLHLSSLNGVALQRELVERDIRLPVILLTEDEDLTALIERVRAGELDYVQRPYEPRTLVETILISLERWQRRQREESELQRLQSRIAQLTPRESQVTLKVLQGLSNKEVATELDISVRTVEKHRAAVMSKLGANNIADLFRISRSCEILYHSFLDAATGIEGADLNNRRDSLPGSE